MLSLLHCIWEILPNESNLVSEDLVKKRPYLTKYPEMNFEDLFDPYLLDGMQEAVTRIQQALLHKEKMLIYGDYDVDGIVATALLAESLEKIGGNISIYLPHRMKDGYGLNPKYINNAEELGINLIITVDNGISAHTAIQKAQEMGIDVVVTDHHEPPVILPECITVNPKKHQDNYPFSELCGTAVAYKLVTALSKHYPDILTEAYLKWLTEYVAFATITDCLPLYGENRALVKMGIQAMRQTQRNGLNALIERAGIEKHRINAMTLGFVLGPRVNASGRIDDPHIGYELLRSTQEDTSKYLAAQLDTLNTRRRSIVEEHLIRLEEVLFPSENPIIYYHPDIHVGVIGLLAGKLAEKYHRPTFVMTQVNGAIVGSSRNPLEEIHITKVLTEHKNLLEHFGGHSQAAGFRLRLEELPAFEQALENSLETVLKLIPSEKKILIDRALTYEDWKDFDFGVLERLAPFGIGNPEPLFLIERLVCSENIPLGNEGKHVKWKYGNGEIVLFSRPEWIAILKEHTYCDVIVRIDQNIWKDKITTQGIVVDMKVVTE